MNKLILIFAAALAISCGDNKKTDKTDDVQIGTKTVETTTITPDVTNDANVATVSINGNDQMKYDQDVIRVKAGQKVKLTLKHVGKMDKNVMGHNWALLANGADMATVGQAAAEAASTDYIPAAFKDKILVHTKMLGGGESDTIEFDAPAPGTYVFMCTFPGHYALMNGKFIVE